MRLPLISHWRLVRIKTFMIAIIAFSIYLSVSYTILQAVRNKSNKLTLDSTPMNLANVVMHLDLKGSPPKILYLKSILPKLRDLGVTGLLIEYEDMFPYEGKLANLSAVNAYGKYQLQEFLKLAVTSGFDIIPLVQTFGHLQYVLKMKQFQHLRENPLNDDSICPSKIESKLLIKDMLQQVIKFHQNIFPLKYFHIGCDEVDRINQCAECVHRKQTNTIIYVNHVKTVRDIIEKITPNTIVLMWDDMLRSITMEDWQTIENLKIEPVYWDYRANVLQKVSHVALAKYHKKFNNIWIATAFKGADGSNETFPDIKERFINHLNWMQVIQNYKFGGEQDTFNFKGIILTGWSRYSHGQPLCELLPASIPSLILNLLLIKKIKHGEQWIGSEGVKDFFNKNLNDDFIISLNCNNNIDIDDFDVHQCFFEGNDVYQIIENCDTNIANITYVIDKMYKHKARSYVNFFNVKESMLWCNNTVGLLNAIKDKMATILSNYYDNYVIKEYINYKFNNVEVMLNKFYKLQSNIMRMQDD